MSIDLNEVLDTVTGLNQAERTKAEARYRLLLGKVVEGRATKADANEIYALLPTLELNHDGLKKDLDLLKQRRDLKAGAAKRPEALAKVMAARNEIASKQDERMAFLDKTESELIEMGDRLVPVEYALRVAEQAEYDLARLEAEHGRLIYGTDEAEARKRRRHLIDNIGHPIPNVKFEYGEMTLASAMYEPHKFVLSNFDFIPVPEHQSQAELDDLIRALKEGQLAVRRLPLRTEYPDGHVKFLLAAVDEQTRQYAITPQGINDLWKHWQSECRRSQTTNIATPMILPVRAPGQTVEEFEALKAQIVELDGPDVVNFETNEYTQGNIRGRRNIR